NEIYHYKDKDETNKVLLGETIEKLIILLSPFAPHITEEMWQMIGKTDSVHDQSWPKHDEKALKKEEVEIVVQINGKVRDKLTVAIESSKEEMEKKALEKEKIKVNIEGKEIIKVIVVPKKLINIVVKG